MGVHLPNRQSGRRPGPWAKRSHGNPLERTCDRVQRWVARVLIVAVLIGAPWAAAAVGLSSYRAEMRTVHASATWRAVDARLVRAAAASPAAGGAESLVKTPVRWTEPDGTTRTVPVRVKAGTPADTAVRVWVDHDAAVSTTPPHTSGQAVTSAWLAAVFTVFALTILVEGLWKGFIFLMNRRRYRQWEAEWAHAEPRMSGRPQD